MKISKRLKTCASMVAENSKIVDVGTDHAYLPIFLALQNKISSAIACDFRKGPLEIAKKNIEKFDLEKIIEYRLSNGLEKIKENEVNTVIMAGMGGTNIVNILKNCNWENKKYKDFILNPMSSEDRLRKFLAANGYETIKEVAVFCSGQVYTVMAIKFTGASKKIDSVHTYIGKIYENDNQESKMYIKKQLKNLENKIKGANISNDIQKSVYYSSLINRLKLLIRKDVLI